MMSTFKCNCGETLDSDALSELGLSIAMHVIFQHLGHMTTTHHEGDRLQPIKDPNYNAQERYEKEYHQVPASDEEDTDLSVVLSYLAGSKQMRDMKHPQMMRACPLCRGDKYIRFLDSPDIVCPKCNGTGQQPCQPVDDKVV
jgi:hypothetical protein